VKTSTFPLTVVTAAVFLSGASATAATNAFGTSLQETAVPAQAFMPMTPGITLGYAPDGYVVVSPAVGTGWFSAPVPLEAGARIERLECDFHDHVTDEAHVHLRRRLQFPLNIPPAVEDIIHIHTPTGLTRYVRIGADFDHTVQTRAGTRAAYYVIDVEMTNDGTGELRFLGCRLLWSRQVSPAPLTARFSDVPTSHPFHRFVEALVASGVTGGCTTTAYCPDAPMTRGQMAVFLSVALGLHFPF